MGRLGVRNSDNWNQKYRHGGITACETEQKAWMDVKVNIKIGWLQKHFSDTSCGNDLMSEHVYIFCIVCMRVSRNPQLHKVKGGNSSIFFLDW